MNKNLSTIIMWAKNKPGVLYRILWLFRRKMFNIESLTAGHSEKPGVSRITITTTGEKEKVANMCKQIAKLVDILRVEDVPEKKLVIRELAMIKVAVPNKSDRLELLEIVKHFRSHIVSYLPEGMIVMITGGEEKIDVFHENMKRFTILEFVRTGRTALFK